MADDQYLFRLISNNVRFGYGRRVVDGHPVLLEGYSRLL